MNSAIETTATETTATAKPVVAKTPSKKSQALVIFQTKLVERSQGLFASNKEFRGAVLKAIETELGVTTASAATMYNAAKKDAEAADAAVALGRDPKKVKAVGTGARGRPVGSKNKPKEVAPAAAAEPVVVTTENVVVIADAEPQADAPTAAEIVAAAEPALM